ncbi:cell division protein ftsj, variant [Neurospora crassa OR74A]|uniref:rRNA methyltransferase 2, mitochondrial n=1 Tax=Neurospora crassa (strain ATCC 24698 / 74-OR23-1A / CBS 708.71 / DSM 1257 / FGSC 987) TaxID=367110 RepID=V5ILK9_NEUCR|nr:cell division protein ftsj, variant [Neurospora crassa OR74A]ESA42255.1 cell division protein ftsj, variant [Neurospora crassa OR74A]|eukprot:XP_011395053.1 cell division protein ftsj, variant [Neurospora crassa OR74A]
MLPRRLPPRLFLRPTPTSTTPRASLFLTTSTITTTTTTNPISPSPSTNVPTTHQLRLSSSSSNSQWKARQSNDYYARSARTAGLKSRAAFKLLEINKKYRLFRRNSSQIVVDLGFAPGSWSQVALDLTKPDGKVVGIDIIPAQPPRGVSSIQGNFLSDGVRGLVKGWLREEEGRGRVELLRKEREKAARVEQEAKEREERERVERERVGMEEARGSELESEIAGEVGEGVAGMSEARQKEKNNVAEDVVQGVEKLELTEKREEQQPQQQQQKQRQQQKDVAKQEIFADRPSYIELERMAVREAQLQQPEVLEQDQRGEDKATTAANETEGKLDREESTEELEEGHQQEEQQQPRKKKQPEQMRLVDVVLSDMMMNTSGISFKDHAGSMDLCYAALSFANDTLKPGGHFVCKFYQGSEDKKLENMLKKLFTKVHRDKPDSSRSESKEAYFVALNRRGDVILEDIPI